MNKLKIDFVAQITHKYLGFGIHESECELRIIKFENTDFAIILFSDTGIGTSVTNASDQLATEVFNKYSKDYNLKYDQLIYVETYPYNDDVTYDKISYSIELKNDIVKYSSPEWESLDENYIEIIENVLNFNF